MKNDNKKPVLIGALILAVLACIFAAVYFFNLTPAGTGQKNIAINVTNSQGETASYKLSTNAGFLKQAMDELSDSDPDFSYSGTTGSYGLMVETINGERAIYDRDGAYWALYVNDEYGRYGADSQPVTDGDKYTWKYETSQ